MPETISGKHRIPVAECKITATIELSKAKGVYTITNLENGKVYVGSTCNSFKKRWSEHLWTLNAGKHRNPHLQSAWNQYGEEVFQFNILEPLDKDKDTIRAKEQSWLDYYGKVGEVYNIAMNTQSPPHSMEWSKKVSRGLIAAHTRGCFDDVHNEEWRRKTSEGLKRAWRRGVFDIEQIRGLGTSSAQLYPAFVHTDTGEIIPAGMNLEKMCRDCGFKPSSMRRVQRGQRNHHKGWRIIKEAL